MRWVLRVEVSGGSAANTLVGLASFGGTAAFVGRVSDDQLGSVFAHDIRAAGVEFTNQPATDGEPTGRCLIVVTDDAQRTMNTYLGASAQLGPADVDEDLIARAQILYLEGYLWDEPDAKDAYRFAAAPRTQPATEWRSRCLTRSASIVTATSSSSWWSRKSTSCSPTRRRSCRCTRQTIFDDALQQVSRHCEIAALTRSEKGAVIVTRDEVHVIDAAPVADVVDTTGAGDLFAAGFLFGLTHGYHLGTAGSFGALAAAEVISHFGARPETRLGRARPTPLGRVTRLR